MNFFTDHADTRITAALERVVARSADAARRELDAFRAVSDAVRGEAQEQLERQLETERLGMRRRLEAIEAEARAQVELEQAARREALDGAQAEILRLHTQVAAQRKSALAQVAAAHAEAEAARAEASVLLEVQGRLERELAELRTQLQTERATRRSKEFTQIRLEAGHARGHAEAGIAVAQVDAARTHAEAARAETGVLMEAQGQPEPELAELRTQLQTEQTERDTRLSKELALEAGQARGHAEARTAAAQVDAAEAHVEWTPSRLIQWGATVGPQTTALVEQILASRLHPEQGCRSCLGLLRLAKHYGPERVEAACGRAIAVGARSYRHVETILKHGLDRVPLDEDDSSLSPRPPSLTPRPVHANVRGPDYYRREIPHAD